MRCGRKGLICTAALLLCLGIGLGCSWRGGEAELAGVEWMTPSSTNQHTESYLKLARRAIPPLAGSNRVVVVLQAGQLNEREWVELDQAVQSGRPVLLWGGPVSPPAGEAPGANWSERLRGHFASVASTVQLPERNETWPLKGPVYSLPRGATGVAAGEGGQGRWIPVAHSEDAESAAQAWPATVRVEAPAREGAPCAIWAWVGVPPADRGSQKVLARILRDTILRMQRGAYLLRAGPSAPALEGASELSVEVRLAPHRAFAAPLRVAAELLDTSGRTARRVSAPAQEKMTLSLGTLPRLPDLYRDYLVRVTLSEADSATPLDTMVHAIRVLPDREPAGDERVGVTGTRFTLGRRPLFLLGAPAQVRGLPAAHPLDPVYFDPHALRRELDLAQAASLQMVQVNLEQADQAPGLRWLKEELRARAMVLLLRVGGLDPLRPELDRARALLDAAQIRNDPVVWALDLGPSDDAPAEAARAALDEAWRVWLREQYGDEAQAERLWGRPLWRQDGQAVAPPVEALEGRPGDAAGVAAYRRFLDDVISRRYGILERSLADWGQAALVTGRAGVPRRAAEILPDPATGWIHFDFMSLDARCLVGDDAANERAGFATSYARGISGGKPVLWLNAGYSVERGSDGLQQQAGRVRDLLPALLRHHAAGVGVCGLDGAFGWTEPDGRWRPAGDVLRRFNLRVRHEAGVSPAWGRGGVEYDRDVRGFAELFEANRSEAPAVWPEVRPAGVDQSSVDMPDLTMGGIPHSDPAPFTLLNAEWGFLRAGERSVARGIRETARVARDQELTLELWNTGSARWVGSKAQRRGTVWVRASRAGAREVWLPVSDTARGQAVTLTWKPVDPGLWSLRAWRWGSGGFGERLDIQAE